MLNIPLPLTQRFYGYWYQVLDFLMANPASQCVISHRALNPAAPTLIYSKQGLHH